ncbi:MAG: hypothetical protein QXI92_02765 [Candidatus Nitrosocaldus sp.]
MIRQIQNTYNNRQRRRKKYIFSEAEKKLLLFFVKEKSSEVPFWKLKYYCINDLGMNLSEFYHVYTLLLELNVLVEILGEKYDQNHSILVDIPAIVKNYLGLRYYSSAAILAALYKLCSYHIAKDIEYEFTLWDLSHLQFYDIKLLYKYERGVFKNCVRELISKSYLINIHKGRYKFNYKIVPKEVVGFLLLV